MPFWNVWVTKIAKALILLVLQDSFLTNLLLLSFGKIVLAKELWLNMRNLFWWWPYFAKKMCKYYQFANQWNSNALKEAKHEKSQCCQLCLILQLKWKFFNNMLKLSYFEEMVCNKFPDFEMIKFGQKWNTVTRYESPSSYAWKTITIWTASKTTKFDWNWPWKKWFWHRKLISFSC